MRKEVLSHYDTLTVGECSGVTLEEAAKYASENESELNMVFQFELMDLDADPVTGSKWTDKKMELAEIRQVMSKWQNGLEGIAWNSLFWDNHDQPRIVSRIFIHPRRIRPTMPESSWRIPAASTSISGWNSRLVKPRLRTKRQQNPKKGWKNHECQRTDQGSPRY